MNVGHVGKTVGGKHKDRMKNLFDDGDTGAKPSGSYSKGSSNTAYQGQSKGTWNAAPKKRCAHSHPPLPLGKTDKGEPMVIYGGACSDPIITDMDVSVGLDWGFRLLGSKYGFVPWNDKIEILYEIEDMNVPKDVADFKKLIDFLEICLRAGKKVHVGCIGGHGRTGTLLAALVSRMLPDVKDAIGYVRKNYCEKAVESAKQVDWLHQHFGVMKVKGYKEGVSYSTTQTSKGGSSGNYGMTQARSSVPKSGVVATALPGPECIWFKKPIAKS